VGGLSKKSGTILLTTKYGSNTAHNAAVSMRALPTDNLADGTPSRFNASEGTRTAFFAGTIKRFHQLAAKYGTFMG
jgi:hypothetical protein